MSAKQTVISTLGITRKVAFVLLKKGQFKKASQMAHDALLQVPKGIRTADTAALHLIAATAYYAQAA